MTSALVNFQLSPTAPPLLADLESVGIEVIANTQDCSKLVQDVLQCAPDLIVCFDPLPSESLFRAIELLGETSPRPVLLFTTDGNADHIARAMQAGVHAYVVNGYGPGRLRSLIHLAQARFTHDQALYAEVRDATGRLEERKVVERAKGILMRARQVSDDDAFQMLRTASMHTNQRMGQVSRHIIHSARFAEDLNRAGQLRMLSQRLVKLLGLQVAGVQRGQVIERLKESKLHIESNISALGKSLSPTTFGDLLGQVMHTWSRLRQALQQEARVGELGPIDELAELLLHEAERLTDSLQNAGAAPPLQVLNVAGRQRMLSQRHAKYALLCALGIGSTALSARHEAGMAESRVAIDEGFLYLNQIPLSSPEIRETLQAAAEGWQQLQGAVAGSLDASGAAQLTSLERIAVSSEALLEIFEQLTALYERSMQMLAG
jgi:two-component system, response regulator PdtaR